MVDSIQSLIEVRPVLDEMLQGQAIALTDEEWEILIELTTILEPCKVVVEALCREDADLLSAEISLKWLFTTLENIGNPLALELSEEFKVEIEKWKVKVVDSMNFQSFSSLSSSSSKV